MLEGLDSFRKAKEVGEKKAGMTDSDGMIDSDRMTDSDGMTDSAE